MTAPIRRTVGTKSFDNRMRRLTMPW